MRSTVTIHSILTVIAFVRLSAISWSTMKRLQRIASQIKKKNEKSKKKCFISTIDHVIYSFVVVYMWYISRFSLYCCRMRLLWGCDSPIRIPIEEYLDFNVPTFARPVANVVRLHRHFYLQELPRQNV